MTTAEVYKIKYYDLVEQLKKWDFKSGERHHIDYINNPTKDRPGYHNWDNCVRCPLIYHAELHYFALMYHGKKTGALLGCIRRLIERKQKFPKIWWNAILTRHTFSWFRQGINDDYDFCKMQLKKEKYTLNNLENAKDKYKMSFKTQQELSYKLNRAIRRFNNKTTSLTLLDKSRRLTDQDLAMYGFIAGNITKYLVRDKGQDEQDLDKCIDYLHYIISSQQKLYNETNMNQATKEYLQKALHKICLPIFRDNKIALKKLQILSKNA